MFGVVFLISEFSAIELIVLSKKIFNAPMKILTPKLQLYGYILPPIIFCKILGV